MAMDLNFAVPVSPFLCLDQPMVINTIAIMLINGCSKEVNLASASHDSGRTWSVGASG